MSRKMLSIVAVVINNLEVNKRFVSSVRQYTDCTYELILVDNASTDTKSIDFFKASTDRYFRFDKLVSLSKAWNKGIELSTGRYVAVVNNDIVVTPNWFAPLKQTLDKNKTAGMVSPMTLWLMKGDFISYLMKRLNNNYEKPYRLKKFKEIVWGEFMLFKRKALEKIGGFNEIYERAAGEDLEIVFQLFSQGFDIYVDPRVFIHHEGGRSQTPDIISRKTRDKYWNRNWEIFASRWSKYAKAWSTQ
jgi:GT2 family glycosyltransferase